MSSTLFTVALNTAPEGTAEKGNIVYKSKQIRTYADGTVLVTRNIRLVEGGELLPALETQGRKTG
jgi:hypothetical protein